MERQIYIEWMRVAYERKILDEKGEHEYLNLVSGEVGEREFSKWVNNYIGEGMFVMRNICLQAGGPRVEVDHLLITPDLWVASEVKNYNAAFTYLNGRSYRADFEMDYNPVERAETVHRVVSRIAGVFKNKPKVETNFVLINEHCYGRTDYAGDVNFLMRCQLRDHLQGVKERITSSFSQAQRRGMINFFEENFIVPMKFEPPTDDRLNWKHLKKGINCPNCLTYAVQVNHKSFLCKNCGNLEKKADGISRAVHDYCILFRKNRFTIVEVHDFLGSIITEDAVYNVVSNISPLAEGYKRGVYSFKN